MVEYLPSKQYVVGSAPTLAGFFIFYEKRVVQVSCVALFIYVGYRVFMFE